MSAKKSTNSKKPVVDKVKRTRKPNALHDKLEKLFTQKRLYDARYLERRFRISSDGGAQDF